MFFSSFFKKILPQKFLKTLRPIYHGFLALFWSFFYNFPSEKLIVIGITGTAGKSTTTKLLAHILNFAGRKCGYVTTVSFFDGEKEYINQHGLSMPGGRILQKHLKQMLEKNCQYAVVECTSEGLAQNRHLGINFATALLTNLYPAHLEAHGSFENYKLAKARLFEVVSKKQMSVEKRKMVFNLQKFIGVNLDNPHADFFLGFPASQKFGITFDKAKKYLHLSHLYLGENLSSDLNIEFEIQKQKFILPLIGKFNAENSAMAVACANMLGVSLKTSAQALEKFAFVAGRMEDIPNNLGFKVFVDYAPEPSGMLAALSAVKKMPHKKIIHLFGSTGGHRDVQKRFEFGKISAQFADYIVVTNDDVYDSSPEEIASNIESGILKQIEATRKSIQYEIVLDRKQAIKKAISLATKGDIVILTGKGSEQFLMLPGNVRVSWDEREVVKEELRVKS